jgi:hypothetical protein
MDFGNALFSEVSDDLIATTYDDERERIYWKDKGFEADYKNLQKQLPGKEIGFVSSTKDEKLWIIGANADTDPGSTYLYDRKRKSVTEASFDQARPLTIEMDVAPNKLTGTTNMNGQSKPIDADPGGALFADGAGALEVLASLPLADGYSLSYRNFDPMKQKSQIRQLKVVGTESVTVPAGTFDAYKLEIVAADNDADKQTVWIDKGSRKVLKISAVLPSLNGAVLTSELTP